MIRIDAVWLATQPLDMRSGVDSCLARVVNVFGSAHPHTAYLFANRRASRILERATGLQQPARQRMAQDVHARVG